MKKRKHLKSILSILCLSFCSLAINAQSSDMRIDKKSIVRFNETYYKLECHIDIPEDKKLQEYLSELIFCKDKSDLKTAYESFLKKYERANTVQTTRGSIIINLSKEYELDGRFSCYHVSANIPGNTKYVQLLLSDRLGEQYTKFLKGIDGDFIFDMQKHELLGIDQIFVPAIADKLKGAFGKNPSLYAEDRCLCIFSKKSEGKFLFNETTEKHFTDYFKQLVGWGQQKDKDTPRFLRGEAALKKFYADNKIAVASADDPEADTISVSVIVSEDGSPVRTEIKKTTGYLPSKKLHEINEKMPKWLPAYQDGKAITKEVTFSLGIHPNKYFPIIDKPSYTGENAQPGNKVFDVVEQMPSFPGGKDALNQFLSSNIKYPVEAEEKGIQGRVICTFIVERDGSISDAKPAISVDPLLDKEALRVISSMPKWNPGKQRGSAVRVKYILPITFRLSEGLNTIVYEGIRYHLSGSKEAMVGINNCTGSVTIPETIKHQGVTYSVTEIGLMAFNNCTGLTSVTIPKSVKAIGNHAFAECSSLTSITMPNGVTSIGDDAFKNCSGLTEVTIPSSVTSIGGGAFSDCTGLTSVIIPNSVTSIGDQAFSGCSALTSVTIPSSVTSIGGWAFKDCSSLTSIVVESGNPKYDSRDNCNAIIETATNTLIESCKNTVIPKDVNVRKIEKINRTVKFTAPVIIKDDEVSQAKEDTVKSRIKLFPSVVFSLCKAVVERSQEPNVEMVAEYANKNKGCKILIEGYAADPDCCGDNYTWKEWQYILSKRRADNVKEMLVKKYSIDADRIITKGCGFTDKLFDEIEFNRVVLFYDITK